MNECDFNKSIKNITIDVPIQEQIKESKIPFVIWGTGSLSYSIKKYMDFLNVKVSCYWVDGNLESREKDGIPVLSLIEIQKRYEKFNVVFGHSKYELKNGLKEKCENIQKVFCIPNVCYNRYQRMELAFFDNNSRKYYDNFCLLEDDVSKKCMIAYLQCKISENVSYIIDVFDGEINYFNNSCFFLQKDEVYVDVGAYTGDSLKLFLQETNYNYKKIFAYEPEEENFIALEQYVKKQNLKNIVIQKIGTWVKKEILQFDLDEESSSLSLGESQNKTLEIEVDALDSLLKHEKVTIIKINFLTGVKETIEGMSRIMIQYKPKLVITVGFDEYALLTIPKLIKKINPAYKLHLRFAAAMPARLLLFAL